MNREKNELDLYLESIGGLINAYNEDKRILDSGFFEIGPGWYKLIIELIDDLIKLGWDRHVAQVKEKYGGLRFYIGVGDERIWSRIAQAEEQASKTCEMCGNPGVIISRRGWLRCACKNHEE